MTVCIAAICKAPNPKGQPAPVPHPYMIIGASDRMITAGDIEYEPPRWKIWNLGQYAAGLISGNATIQHELWERTNAGLMSGTTTPFVRSIADAYAQHFVTYRRELAERSLLLPIGLNISEFLNRQKDLSPEMVEHLTIALRGYELDAETIICGVDTKGVHIFVVSDPGYVSILTGIGFAAVGMGQKHAESEFMVSRYTFDWSFEHALFLTYAAKRRAETAPGVGQHTDMFVIGPHPIVVTIMPDNVVEEVKKTYDATDQKVKDARNEGLQKIEQWVQTFAAPQTPPPQTPPQDQPPPTSGNGSSKR